MPKSQNRAFPASFPEREVQRFWESIAKAEPDTCWNWVARGASNGYGRPTIRGQKWLSHRMAFFLVNGVDPGDLCVLHQCDNRRCCNPKHLALGTRADNSAQAVAHSIAWANRHKNSAERHWNFKLSFADVQAIRQRYAQGGTSYKKLGKEFGIAHSYVKRLVHFMFRKES